MLSTAAAIKLSKLECTLRYSCKTCISLVSLNGNCHRNLAGSSLPFPQKICCVGIPEDSERHSAFPCISTGIFKHCPRLFTKPICSTLCQSKRTRGLLWGGKAGYSYPLTASSQYLPLCAVDYLATQWGFTLGYPAAFRAHTLSTINSSSANPNCESGMEVTHAWKGFGSKDVHM